MELSYKGAVFFGNNKEISVKDLGFYRHLAGENKRVGDFRKVWRFGL